VTGLGLHVGRRANCLQIEALRLPGRQGFEDHSKLGDVDEESIDAAAAYVRIDSPKDRG